MSSSAKDRFEDYIPGEPTESSVIVSKMGKQIASQNEEIAQLRKRIETSSLTGLPNQEWLNRRVTELQQAIEDDPSGELARGLAVLFLDLEGFKRINDELGHEEGDEHLRKAALAIAESIRTTTRGFERDSDELATTEEEPQTVQGDAVHQHGDEFCAILYGVRSPDNLPMIAERIRANLAAKSGNKLGAHIGYAMLDEEIKTVPELLKAADLRANADRDRKKALGQLTR